MNELMKQIVEMHEKFGLNYDKILFTNEEKQFRIVSLKEELQEYIDSSKPEDELDALIDLMVFALGTVYRQGYHDIFDEAFRRVMDANCNKIVGPNEKRNSFSIDLQKPDGWTAPDFTDLFE